jgi:hypothetical protein
MIDNFEFILHSPLTEEDWNKLADVEHENTNYVTFQTPRGRQVKYIKCEVLDKIRDEIEALSNANQSYWHSGYTVDRGDVFDIIDKYKVESEE